VVPQVLPFLLLAICANFQSQAAIDCGQRLLVLQRRHPQLHLRNADGASGFWQADGLAVGVTCC
jgi:hypothetical protein